MKYQITIGSDAFWSSIWYLSTRRLGVILQLFQYYFSFSFFSFSYHSGLVLFSCNFSVFQSCFPFQMYSRNMLLILTALRSMKTYFNDLIDKWFVFLISHCINFTVRLHSFTYNKNNNHSFINYGLILTPFYKRIVINECVALIPFEVFFYR